MEAMRLNKYISDSGLCSRREADKLIEDHQVTINGKPAVIGTKVTDEDIVRVKGRQIEHKEKPVYIAFNKPVGIVTTTEKGAKDNIIDFINYPKRIFPIGRLDKDSEGLIFLTNDGDIVNKILRAGNNHEKEYIVHVDKPITADFLKKMADGVRILGTITKKCVVEKTGKNSFKIILTEGMNRQIRRMCEALSYHVTQLKRVRIMNIQLGNLPTGKWRYLTEAEMKKINEQIKQSIKTEEASVKQPKV